MLRTPTILAAFCLILAPGIAGACEDLDADVVGKDVILEIESGTRCIVAIGAQEGRRGTVHLRLGDRDPADAAAMTYEVRILAAGVDVFVVRVPREAKTGK